MRYPNIVRKAIGNVPIGLNIDGRRKRNALKILDALFSPEGMRTLTVNGDDFTIDTENPNERIFYYAPDNLLRWVRRSALYSLMRQLLLRRGGIFVDIGANLGLYSYLAKKMGAKTLLFEPEPTHFAFLQRNAHHFHEISAVALSDSIGTATLHVGDLEHAGASSLVQVKGSQDQSPYASKVEVQAAPFDHVLANGFTDPSDISLVKIDVEGNEVRTVHGMKRYFARTDAAPIWCEVRGPASNRNGDSYKEVIDVAADYGYHPFVLNEMGSSLRSNNPQIKEFRPKRSPPQVFDLLLIVPDRHSELF